MSDSAEPGTELSGAARDAIFRVHAAEPAISADLLGVERDNSYGAWLEGFACRVKGESRLGEKLSTIAPDATPDEAVRQIPDVIRYTFCVRPEKYTQAYFDITARMDALGYEQYQCKNSWTDPEYKGINSRWVTAGGVRFEVQFHTPDSFHAKHHVTHESYERLRDPRTSRPELLELHTYQQEVSTSLPTPPLAIDIPVFRRKGF